MRDLFEPSNGHLVLIPRLVYAGLIRVQGTDYLGFRLMAALAVVLLVWALYLYARPRVGSVVALAPCLPLLLFGSSAGHVLVGNGFTVLFALSCGLAAFAIISDERRSAPWIACALLCLGVATYSVALPFVAGVAVYLVAQRRWEHLWVPAVPVVLYAAWWIWATSTSTSAESAVAVENLLVTPAWLFQLLGYALAGISGLAYDFGGGQTRTAVAVALAVVAICAYVKWLRSGRMAPGAAGALATFIALSAISVLVASFIRDPSDDRYLYPAAIVAVVVAVEAVAGRRLSTDVVVGLYVVAIVGLAANVLLLTHAADLQRDTTGPGMRTALGALELSQPNTNSDFIPKSVEGEDSLSVLPLAWDGKTIDGNPTEEYLSDSRAWIDRRFRGNN